jgi:Tfp pilus assembly protein PilF
MRLTETLAQARDFYRTGHLPAARALLDSILAHDAHDAEALHLLGVIADASGDPGRGAALIRQALAIRESPRFRCNLGMVLCHLGQHAPAADALRAALAHRPDYPEALNNLGVALEGLRESAEAEAAYRAAIAARADYAEAWGNLGNTLRRVGRLDEAAASFETAVAIGERAMTGGAATRRPLACASARWPPGRTIRAR